MSGISIFEIFKIGIGPSSSHTVGPMKAAREFAQRLRDHGRVPIANIQVDLYGSLALTGRGHATDVAVVLGLSGEESDKIDPNKIPLIVEAVKNDRHLMLMGIESVPFDFANDIRFLVTEELTRHTNGMRFTARDSNGEAVFSEDYYSIGGGFIVRNNEAEVPAFSGDPPFLFNSGATLLAHARENELSIDQLVFRNESTWQSPAVIEQRLDDIWAAMQACIERGLSTDGVLPGRLGVKRRAAKMYRVLMERDQQDQKDALDTVDWVNAFAIAVNEENAAGGRVVTSPTNGAAGIIPAVLMYYSKFVPSADQAGIRRFILAAGAIGILYKTNASISGAEMGCQGEVGVACSMAAAGLVAARQGKNWQLENAAEIGMEHNLGLTCDPIGGLVQIPCIERNAMGAMKAINAARLAMHGDGSHKVSLDQVIATMKQTGLDMSNVYKETSKGGLAVNVPEC